MTAPGDGAQWVDAGERDAFPEGIPRGVTCAGRAFVVVRSGDSAIAAVDRCPHKGEPLSFGAFRDGTLWCRAHGWGFDCRDGRCVAGAPQSGLHMHAARVHAGRVEIAV